MSRRNTIKTIKIKYRVSFDNMFVIFYLENIALPDFHLT